MKQFTLAALNRTKWFNALVEQVQKELDRLNRNRDSAKPRLQAKVHELQGEIEGWSQSLAKPNLQPAVREKIEADLANALDRQQELERQLAETDAIERESRQLVDPKKVVDRLNRLADVLAHNNPSQGNMELSLHIDAIRCHQDGSVVVRTCKLGALAGTTELLASREQERSSEQPTSSDCYAAKPRRRARRRLNADNSQGAEIRAAADLAADVERFAGLGPEWFWQDTFQVAPREYPSLAKDRAAQVGRRRRETGETHEQLAKHFQVSVPTIRKALGIAKATDPSLQELPRKMPRRRWHEDHAAEVAQKKAATGWSVDQLAKHFGMSDTTIRKALEHANRLSADESDVSDRSANEEG